MVARDIYFDNSATTRQYDEVTDFISEISKKTYGNPSSLHTKGIEAERLMAAARKTIAGTLSADEREILFTSGGTEANNLAIRGYLAANPRKGKHILTTAIEHPSVLETCKHAAENGYEADFIGVDRHGLIRLEELEAKLRPDTALISLILVNNETGALQPVNEAVKIKNAKCPAAVLHVDAVQAYGKAEINPGKSGIDLLSVSAHKIHGPKAAGALYASRRIKLKPVLFGGGQEAGLRSGTENVPGIAGFGLAAELKHRSLAADAQRVAAVKVAFLQGLQDSSLDWTAVSPVNSSPYILNIAFPGLRSEVLLHHLEERNIFVSTGSACASRKKSKSHVLTAMGLAAGIVDSAIRFSFSSFNCSEEVPVVLEALQEIVPKIVVKTTKR